MKAKFVYFVLFVFWIPLTLAAQQNRIADYNAISWNAFFLNYKIADKWSAHGEFQWRRSNFLANPQQNLYRVGLNYKVHDQVIFRLGGAYADTYPYGKIPLQAAAMLFPEYRIFQMVSISNPLGKVNLTHRFMLEQRWIGRFLNTGHQRVDGFTFLNRIRYTSRMEYPFENLIKGSAIPYLAAYNEIMIGFGKNIGQNIFDQNRYGILAGIDLQKNIRIEAGYLSQSLLFSRLVDGMQVLQHNRGLIINTNIKL